MGEYIAAPTLFLFNLDTTKQTDMMNKADKMFSEEDRKRLRERFAQLQEEAAAKVEEEKEVVAEGVEEKSSKVEEVVKEAMNRVNAGEALEDIFEFCFEAGKQSVG